MELNVAERLGRVLQETNQQKRKRLGDQLLEDIEDASREDDPDHEEIEEMFHNLVSETITPCDDCDAMSCESCPYDSEILLY